MAAKKKQQNIFQSLGSFLGNIFKPKPQFKSSEELKLPKDIGLKPVVKKNPPNFSSLGGPVYVGPGNNAPNASSIVGPVYVPPGGNVPNTSTTTGQSVYSPPTTGGTTSGQQINYAPTGTAPISGEATGNPVDTAMQKAEDAFKTITDLVSAGGVDLSDPFALDELLANNAAIAAISPFYAQTYARFKKAVDLEKLLGQGKAQRELQSLQQGGQDYQTSLARLLQLGKQQRGEEFEGRGLYESGGRYRTQGLQDVTAEQEKKSYLAGQQRNIQGVKAQEEDLLSRLLLKEQEKQYELAGAQRADVAADVQEAQRVASARQGIAALEGQRLTNENLPEYFKRRGTALSQFLPSQSY